jgi:hypothetical protein
LDSSSSSATFSIGFFTLGSTLNILSFSLCSSSAVLGGWVKNGMFPLCQSIIIYFDILLTSGSPPFKSLPVF